MRTVLILLILAASPAQAAKSCLAHVQGPETAVTPAMELAKVNAQVRWSAKVVAQIGTQYSNWGNAENARTSCRKATNLLGINGYKCRAAGNPCIFE